MPTSASPCRAPRSLTLAQGTQRAGSWTALAVATTALLAGCSIFSTGDAPHATTTVAEPVQEVQVLPAPAPVVALEPSTASAQPVALQSELSATPLPETAPAVAAPAPAPVQAAPAVTYTAAPLHTMAASELAPGYYINVGLFAVPSNGTTAYKKLEQANRPVFSDGVRTPQGALTRVRVGPFPTKAKAATAVKKIHALKLDAVIFRHR